MTEVKPIDTLDDLLAFPEGVEHAEAHDWVGPIAPRTSGYQLDGEITEQYKTLICHDMAGNYGEDRFCNGSTEKNSYRFCNWSGVDTFVYFSHHFITIPPCVWTYTCHNHGVKVLGTMISENEAGVAIWDAILGSDEYVDNVVEALVKVTLAFKFDGWLLNIENSVAVDKVARLISFVEKLTTRIHESDPNFEVIWYDSVTTNGILSWQNELNDRNSPFFDACDGIFLNYGWRDTQLTNSVAYAGSRYLDVYAGIDSFGRGTYGNGGYGTSSALELIRSYPVSAAIFAQGWCYENMGYTNFFSNENVMWVSLMPYLLYHGVNTLPIKTSFCQGFGDDRYEEGELVQEGAWFNLGEQQLQPIWESMFTNTTMTTIKNKTIYSGGSSASVWVPADATFRLFITNFLASELTQASITYIMVNATTQVMLSVEYDDPEGRLAEKMNSSKVVALPVKNKYKRDDTTMGNPTKTPKYPGDAMGYGSNQRDSNALCCRSLTETCQKWIDIITGVKPDISKAPADKKKKRKLKVLHVKPTKVDKDTRDSWYKVWYDFTSLPSDATVLSIGITVSGSPCGLNFGEFTLT